MGSSRTITFIWALLIAAAVPGLGYVAFGLWPALIFLSGYVAGFVLWLAVPNTASFSSIKRWYWLTFALFALHRVEEKVAGFFSRLSDLTGVATPAIVSLPIVLMLILSVGAWVLGPYWFSRGHDFGRFLVWTFFGSMGVSELAHFVFPLFAGDSYGYFPGMLSVFVLAPVAWYSMWRMARGRT